MLNKYIIHVKKYHQTIKDENCNNNIRVVIRKLQVI